MIFRSRWFFRIAALLLVLGSAVILWPRWSAPSLTEQEFRNQVLVTLQQEADTSFIITGYLDLNLRVTARDTRTILPGLLDVSLGTTEAAVNVPGRVSYGFDLGALEPEMITLRGDTVELEVPHLTVYSAEPRLEELEVRTTRGWARLPISTRVAERVAISNLSDALRRQGEAHLQDSTQPRLNTAETLRALTIPILSAAGVVDPYFRIFVGESLVLETGSS